MTINEAIKMTVKDRYWHTVQFCRAPALFTVSYRIPVWFMVGASPAQSVSRALLAR